MAEKTTKDPHEEFVKEVNRRMRIALRQIREITKIKNSRTKFKYSADEVNKIAYSLRTEIRTMKTEMIEALKTDPPVTTEKKKWSVLDVKLPETTSKKQ